MTKKFCDICGELAIQEYGTKGNYGENYSEKQVIVEFEFRMFEDARYVTPDLCEVCRGKLLHKLWLKYQGPN